MVTRRIKILGLVAAGIFLFFQAVSPALAERLESDSFVVQFGNFNISAGEQNSATYNVTHTMGQIAPGPYGEYGVTNSFVGSGFQYIYQIDAFQFVISDISIDLGTLELGVHSSATNSLYITTRGGNGYTVYAYELRPLRHQSGSYTIADTTCDSADCDETIAKVWSNQDVPGFGFNAAGSKVPADFASSAHFRQFADNSGAEDMQVVMSSGSVANADETVITYKAGISSTQAAGRYQTGIVYVAVPGY